MLQHNQRRQSVRLVCLAVSLLVRSPAAAAAPPAIAVTLSPGTAALNVTGQKAFKASVSGTTNTAVTWAVNGTGGGSAALGLITSGGVYTAPATVPASNVVTISATSKADATKSASAALTILNPAPAITSVTPSSVNTQTAFTLTISGSGFLPTAAVSFDDKTPLTITARSATQLTVTGKTSSASGTQIHITVGNPGVGATVSNTETLSVSSPVTVTVSPRTATMRGLTSAAFSEHVANSSTQTVTWSVNGIAGGNAALGTVTSAGVYTAPSFASSPSVTLTAASTSDPTKSDSAQITLENPAPAITAATSPVTAASKVTVTITGTGFVPGAVVMLAGNPFTIASVTSTKITATGSVAPVVGGVGVLTVANPAPGAATSNGFVVSIQNSGTQLSYAAAKRFLEQAAWGPDPASIALVQSIGIDAWITQQFDPVRTPVSTYTLPVDTTSDLSTLQEQFFKNALSGPDQLRQRVAFALGQIAVVSGVKLTTYDEMMPYQQMLLDDAFGTYKGLLKDVTLSPAMGHYLDMVNNDVPSQTTSPDENYARELMQLFSIGLAGLNADAAATSTPAVPAYSENDVRALARIFTGWTYPACLGASKWTNPPCFQSPMVAIESHHDNTAKTLLGTTIQTGTAEGDLDLALSTIEGWRAPESTVPNIAPFVSLRLIQHLVTSNPPPDYVARIAAVYVSSGGDLKQIVRAILEDPDAGNAANSPAPTAVEGHLREPVFYAISLLRALGAKSVYDPPLSSWTSNMGQDLFYSPSVFNYYSPFYQIPGVSAAGPEFQLLNQSTAFFSANYAYQAIHNQISSGIAVDLSPFSQLASDTNSATQTASITTMLNAVSQALLGAPMRQDMLTAIMPAMLATTNATTRAQNAVYLVAVSPRYEVVR